MKPGRELPHLRALTLWRPYPDAILEHVDAPGSKCRKPVENRTWVPPQNLVGAHIALHGGQKYHDQFTWPGGWLPQGNHLIGIVGVVRLAGVLDLRSKRRVIMPSVGEPLMEAELHQLHHLDDDPWWVGPVGWFMTEPTRIELVACKGALGLWDVPTVPANEVRKAWIKARAASAA